MHVSNNHKFNCYATWCTDISFVHSDVFKVIFLSICCNRSYLKDIVKTQPLEK